MSYKERLQELVKTKDTNYYYKQNSQMFDKIVNAIMCTKSTISARNMIRDDEQLMTWIDEQLPQLNGYKLDTKVHWIVHDRRNMPECHYCHQTLKNIDIAPFDEYSRWCCLSHRNRDPLYREHCGDLLEKKYGKGIRCSLQIPAVREKSKETLMKKYDTDNPAKSPVIKHKVKQTFIKNYGVDNNMKSEKGMQEYRDAMQKKHGVDYTWQMPEVIQKSQQTSFERYGVYVTSQSQQAKDKQAETNFKKYGCKSALQNRECHEKSIQTSFNKYGTMWPMQSKEVQDKHRIKYHYDDETFDSSWELAFWIYCKENDINIKHATIAYDYVDERGDQHKYFPDFEVDGKIIEIKGDDQFDETGKMIDKLNHKRDYIAEAKHQCMLKNNITIMKGTDVQKYLDYVNQKYGKGYLKKFKTIPEQNIAK